MASKATGATAWKPERNLKKTSIGRRNVKLQTMNKSKKRSYKPYKGQGK